MKIIKGEKYYTIGEAAALIGRTPRTIINWYSWKEEFAPDVDLPEPKRNLDDAHIRYFTEADIEKLKDFKKDIYRGKLADYNRRKWGKRGSI